VNAPFGAPEPALRVGFAAVARDAFKGDATAVADRALTWLEAGGSDAGYGVASAPEVVRDADAAARVGAWAQSADLDYLLVLHATFATTDLLAPLLRSAPQVGVWAVPESEGIAGRRPGVRPDLDPLPLNSLCGLTMTLSALDHPAVARHGPVKWFYGAPGDASLAERWRVTTAALRGRARLARARVVQIGGTAPAFYRLEERPTSPAITVHTMPLADLYARMAAVGDHDVAAHAASWARTEPRLEAPYEHFLVAARTELALVALASEGRYDAIAVRCWPEFPEACGGMACAAVGRMADRGVPTACEGDVMGALSMLALQAVADGPVALMDLSDLDAARDRLLLWHCGNAPRALAAAPGTRLTTHFNRDGVGVVRDMVLAPGPATSFRLLAGGRDAVIIEGELTDPETARFDGVRGWWGSLSWDGVPTSARDVVAQVLDERLPHHLALARGHHAHALRELLTMLGGRVLPAARVTPALRGATRPVVPT
jgi:L-fucose isomerase-like protein